MGDKDEEIGLCKREQASDKDKELIYNILFNYM